MTCLGKQKFLCILYVLPNHIRDELAGNPDRFENENMYDSDKDVSDR